MTSEERHTVIRVEELSIGYFTKKNESIISQAISLSAKQGELIAIVGPNGAGKSTLLRTLLGMQPKISGRIEVKQLALESYNSHDLAQQISVVLTEAPASKNLSVLEFVSLGRQPYTNWIGALAQKDKEAIAKALQLTETETLSHKNCFELSDGQLQRVAIARALAQDTPIIFLDEPTTHLDLYHKAYLFKLLKKLCKEENKTIIFSTHEIDLAIQLTDKMLILHNKKSHFESPCNLIEAKKFASLFPEEIIGFDAKTGRFVIKE
ncbi:ABC transporter ATP-binding protein [Patiriisocius hiemis]|uniref:ABC transporter ATP-binding protein n=1 Tax=Patiriisocius hiemis TaxID=3075604 RepID=A0ABU2Y9J4_9FLAO|nr:ABC transporter ATP-binding protein [Constantimarinum sp. W242]MDT0554417.1 ABC transporter ATP-binding protein [Constantimarinum sp. W242]